MTIWLCTVSDAAHASDLGSASCVGMDQSQTAPPTNIANTLAIELPFLHYTTNMKHLQHLRFSDMPKKLAVYD